MKKPSYTKSLIALLFVFSPCYLLAQTDDCLSAPTINSSASPGTCTAGTITAGATYTTIAGLPAGCNAANKDVWYKFVAQSTNVTVSLTGALTNGRIQVFSGSCGSLTSINCGTTVNATNLTVGAIYYVRIYSTTNATGGFNVCITDLAPGNDLCANAYAVTPVASCGATANQSLYLATINTPTSTCGTTYDVWYKFTVPTGVHNVKIDVSGAGSSLTSANTFIEAFNTNACGSLTGNSIACNNIGVGLSVPNLTFGNTYYFRVFTTANPNVAPGINSAFSICVSYQPPSNDLCANATIITPVTACGATNNQTLTMATNTGSPSSTFGTIYDVWYKFTVPAAPVNTVNIAVASLGGNLNGNNAYIEVFNASSCGAISTATSIGFGGVGINNGGANGPDVTVGNLTPGATYYFRVFTTADPSIGTAWNFNVCVTYSTGSPINNDCDANIITLTPGTTNTSGTVANATTTGSIPVNCATGTPDDDVWYKFDAVRAYATVAVSAGSTLFYSGAMIQVFSGACGALTTLACGRDAVNLSGLTVGSTYYVRVYSSGATGAGAIAGPAYGSGGAAFNIGVTPGASTTLEASRMNEVFQLTTLSTNNVLQYPWEVTYGPDGFLWVTEARGYKAYRIDPNTGARSTILDISQHSVTNELTSGEHTSFNVQFDAGQNPWPQGGFAGLAIHPQFNSGKPYVYISYIDRYISSAPSNAGVFFKNYLVRFTYNSGTGKLESPVSICDTLPGSSDHNSQRVIVAPVGGTYYLFYAQGDMGAGQFGNASRINQAQVLGAYEGKILRFNLEPDGDGGAYDKWIPDDNPFNGATQSAVWAAGIRNNQGFAYDTSRHLLYGSSHGPFSDDEINVIEKQQNYGHPFVEGFAQDGNYNGITAGAAPNMNPPHPSACPIITNEVTAAAGIANYKDPLFSAYTTPTPMSPTNFTTMSQLWNTTAGANDIWPSEAWSGLDLYSSTLIPGWKRSLVAAGLKWGRLIRLRLGPVGTTTLPSGLAFGNTGDTVTYLQSTNRYRDLAFAPNGKDIYVIMDNSSATSGPGIGNPITPGCPGCLIKYTFLGYNVNAGSSNRSYIPASIVVAPGKNNACDSVNTVTINAANGNTGVWVPLTDTSSNIVAEIYAIGHDLGQVTAKVYHNANAIRSKSGKKYLDRNITITPQFQPGGNVKIRLYITKAEYDALQASSGSGISIPADVKIFKNNDPCGSNLIAAPAGVTMDFNTELFGTNAYVLQGTINSFSTFYFGPSTMITLPVNLLTFTGSLQTDNTALLKWQTTHETNTSNFVVERSTDSRNFQQIGTVAATGNNGTDNKYSFIDYDVTRQSSSIIYYRLKMVDNDGSYTYSDIVTITLPFITSKVALFPNPAAHEVNVTITTAIDGKVKWQLMDNAGRIVIHNSIAAKKGNNNIVINLNRLSTGTYFLIISGSDIDQKVKLEKL